MALSASTVITLLGLQPHPEGGHYRETYRDKLETTGRGASSAIYYLLHADDQSHWHRVDAPEIWHHYAGAPLRLRLSRNGGAVTGLNLGSDLEAGQRPQVVVPAGVWQAAVPLPAVEDWTLVGCTVAPAFQFDGFEMAPPGWQPGAG